MKSLVNIYKFKDYKRYLSAVEEDLSKHQRGFRSRLSEALMVQNAYISKVLNQSKFQFTLEQTMNLSKFLELNNEENTYLIWLVEWSRAGTKDLQNFIAGHINRAQAQHLAIDNRVGEVTVISETHQNRFYSHWLYAGAYMLSTIPAYNSLENMANALRVDPKVLREILVFLVECGLLNIKGDTFAVGTKQVHLSKNSPNAIKSHTNWRLKSIDDLSDPHANGLHYSTISSLSLKDAEKLRLDFMDVIENYLKVVRASPEETACCFNLDFFKIIKD